jgi:hypothetical protein
MGAPLMSPIMHRILVRGEDNHPLACFTYKSPTLCKIAHKAALADFHGNRREVRFLGELPHEGVTRMERDRIASISLHIVETERLDSAQRASGER